MIPKYSQIYEELPEDIFQSFKNPVAPHKRVVVTFISTKLDLDYDLIQEIKIIAAWANAQGLKGYIIDDLKFEMPVFSEDIFSNRIKVTCEIYQKNVGLNL